MYERIILEQDAGVATIALNRPERLNAFDGRMHEDLYAAIGEVAADDGVRCVVLRGEGRGFSAGADLAGEDLRGGGGGAPDLGAYLRRTYGRTVTEIASMEKPVVASLHGPVYGAGVGLALACDLRVAARSAKFSVAFIKIGLMPDAGVSFFLPRVVGLGRALQMSLTGDPVGADEALGMGLVNRVVPDESLAGETSDLAHRLASMPTAAIGRTKRALYASFENDLATSLEQEAEGQTFCGYTQDHEEGVRAFFEKREARFTGR